MANELQPNGRSNTARLGRKSRPRRSRAGVADSRPMVLIGTGGVMVTAGGVLMAVTPKHAWVNVWSDTGSGLLVLGLTVAMLGLYLHFRKPRRESPEEVEPQLSVDILSDSQIEGRGASAMIAAIHVSIENRTDRRIRIVGCEFRSDSGGRPSWEQYATDQEREGFRAELERLENAQTYGPSLQLPAWVNAHDRISGWILKSVTRTPAGGTPACTIVIADDPGNSYEAKLPSGEPRSYPAKG